MKVPFYKLLIISFIGSLFYFLIGFVIFDLILGSYTEAHTTQISGFKKSTDFSFLFLYISCLAYSILLTFTLHHTTILQTKKAFMFSAILGVLIAAMTDFYWYASSNFYSNFIVIALDFFGAALSVGLTGGLIFVLLKKQNK